MQRNTSKHVYRFQTNGITITAASARNLLPLISSADDPDYEVGGDFATACQCEEGATVQSIRLFIHFRHATAGTVFRWAIRKNPNASLTTEIPDDLWSNNPSSANNILRKNTVAAGQVVITANNLASGFPVLVKRKALARIGQIHEDDTLGLIITNDHATQTGTFAGWGKIYVAEN